MFNTFEIHVFQHGLNMYIPIKLFLSTSVEILQPRWKYSHPRWELKNNYYVICETLYYPTLHVTTCILYSDNKMPTILAEIIGPVSQDPRLCGGGRCNRGWFLDVIASVYVSNWCI